MALNGNYYTYPPATAGHKWAGILAEIREIYRNNYSESNIERIGKVFYDMIDLFTGRMEGYYKCDTKYHDLEHTLETTRITAKIINNWNKSRQLPTVSKRFFELGVIAALFHDTGYIRKHGDIEGTGAKYTFIHEERSIEFAKKYALNTIERPLIQSKT
jgi:HD superfamily phosphodiesterase